MNDARYVALLVEDDMYEIQLFDGERKRAGHGYRGPSKKRADGDLTYWTKTKGLERIEPQITR